jgi:hypothetical protein
MPKPTPSVRDLLQKLEQDQPKRFARLVDTMAHRRAAKVRRAELAAENRRLLAEKMTNSKAD